MTLYREFQVCNIGSSQDYKGSKGLRGVYYTYISIGPVPLGQRLLFEEDAERSSQWSRWKCRCYWGTRQDHDGNLDLDMFVRDKTVINDTWLSWYSTFESKPILCTQWKNQATPTNKSIEETYSDVNKCRIECRCYSVRRQCYWRVENKALCPVPLSSELMVVSRAWNPLFCINVGCILLVQVS